MTTQPCEICMEDKLLSQHTYCPNGHLGGCQKCHMNLVKTLYETSTTGKVFADATTAQNCMFCRQHMWDRLMGENWSQKLSKVQPLMCYNMMERLYGRYPPGGGGREEIVEKYNGYVKPITEDYKFIEGAFVIHEGNINELCKTIGDEEGWIKCQSLENYTKGIHEQIKAEEIAKDTDEPIIVEEIMMKGKKFYHNPETRELYDPETEEAVGILPIGYLPFDDCG